MRSHVVRSKMLAALIIAAAPAVPAQTWASSPKFTIKQSDDRFRADTMTVISSSGNRISKKSIAGGRHIDKQGVFLNPVVTVDRVSGEVTSLSFDLLNVVQKMTGLPELNSLGRPLRISFLTGEGQPIVLDIEGGDRKYGDSWCTSTVVTCFSLLIESGRISISIEDYQRLMSATALAIKVDGSERGHIYEVPDVDPTFISNLRTFYADHLANAQ